MRETLPRTCQKLREWLPEYAEGKLRGAPATEVARHLVTCPRCTQEVSDLRTMLAALQSVPAKDLPEGLVASVAEAVVRRGPRPAGRPFWSRVALPATVATGVLAVLLTLHTLEQGGDRAILGRQPALAPEVKASRMEQRQAIPKAAGEAKQLGPATTAPMKEGEQPGATAGQPSPAASREAAPSAAPAPAASTREQSPSDQAAAPKTAPPAKGRPTGPRVRGGREARVELRPTPAPPRQYRYGTRQAPSSVAPKREMDREAAVPQMSDVPVTGEEPKSKGPVGPQGPAGDRQAKVASEAAQAEAPAAVGGGRGGGGGGGALGAGGGGGRGGGGDGMRGGGGGMAGGGAWGDVARGKLDRAPEAARRPGPRAGIPTPWREGRPRAGYQRGRGRPGRSAGGRAGVQQRRVRGSSAVPSDRAQAPGKPGPAAARAPQVALTRAGDGLAVSLLLDSAGAGGDVTVHVAGREVWRGAASDEQVVLLSESAATKMRVLPVTISAGRTTRSYTLYAPSFAHLGQLQGGSTTRRYQNTPLGKALSDLSWRAGVVLLVEGPPEAAVNADVNLELPQAAVESLARFAGYTVHTRDFLVYTLTLPPSG